METKKLTSEQKKAEAEKAKKYELFKKRNTVMNVVTVISDLEKWLKGKGLRILINKDHNIAFGAIDDRVNVTLTIIVD